MSRTDKHPEKTEIMSVPHAVYRAARDYRGGVNALALELGENYNVFQKRVNPDYPAHLLRAKDVFRIAAVTKDERLLISICHSIGAVHYSPLPLTSVVDHLKAVANTQRLSATFTESIAPLLANREITSDELGAIELAGYRYISHIYGVIAGATISSSAPEDRQAA